MGKQLKTGSKCPHCKKGKLHPTGLWGEKGIPETKSGEVKRTRTEFRCARCHKKFNAWGIELRN